MLDVAYGELHPRDARDKEGQEIDYVSMTVLAVVIYISTNEDGFTSYLSLYNVGTEVDDGRMFENKSKKRIAEMPSSNFLDRHNLKFYGFFRNIDLIFPDEYIVDN